MTLTARAEEILETLGVELLDRGKDGRDASILKDDAVLKELVDAGCVEVEGGWITLTEKGKVEARSCVRRHRLAERLLTDILDCKKKMLHDTSCMFEHLLHKGLDENICTLLGHPKTCPHGRPIPEGTCCREAKRTPQKLLMPLTELETNRKAKISYLQTQERSLLQKIIAVGALPNTEVILIQKFPSYVLRLGKSQFAIDEELASHIYVRVL